MAQFDRKEFQRRAQRIEHLLNVIQSSADARVSADAVELIQSVMELHSLGIERMLEIIFEKDGEIIDRFAEDDLAANLLLLHGLHPLDIETRVMQALEKVRPLLRSHGGNVEFLGVNDGIARLRLQGSCNGCASSAITLKSAIEEAIYEAAPDIAGLEVEGVAPEPSPPVTAIKSVSGLVQLERAPGKSGAAPNGKDKDRAASHSASHSIESCELCGKDLAPGHQHLIEVANRRLVCACDPCAILFSGLEGRYRRAPGRIRYLPDFNMTDAEWESLMIPINMAFFFHNSTAGRAMALYPSPAGATESLLELEAWEKIVERNPPLRSMESDVEALLVNRMGRSPRERGNGEAEYFIVPIDECYKLTGLIRARWRGLSGGAGVWEEIERFFAELKQRSTIVKEAACA